MKKGTILGDTFEQLSELVESTAKKTVKEVVGIVNPFSSNESNKSNESKSNSNHTPVDFKDLQSKYQNKDTQQADLLARSLKNRYFQMVKNDGERSIEREKMEKQEKIRNENYTDQDKKRREQQQKAQSQGGGMPGGKGKRGVATKRKTSEDQHAENKPASGKQ